MTAPLDKILLRGLVFWGRHGSREEEKALGQRFELDLDLFLDTRAAARSDHLPDTVSYSTIFHEVRSVVEESSYNLIETIAERVASRVLGAHSEIAQVTVRVKKPWAPIERGVFSYVGVEITRARHE